MTTETQPLIDAIVEQSDDRRAQRFLDDLRQEGVLPGRRNRWAYRLHRVRQTFAGWLRPMAEFAQDMLRRRRPAAYWVELMDQLIAEGKPAERAAREVARQMEREDRELTWRWVYLPLLLGLIGAWALFGIVLAGGV